MKFVTLLEKEERREKNNNEFLFRSSFRVYLSLRYVSLGKVRHLTHCVYWYHEIDYEGLRLKRLYRTKIAVVVLKRKSCD